MYEYVEAFTDLLGYQRQSGRRFYPLMLRRRQVRVTFWSHCHTGVSCKTTSFKSFQTNNLTIKLCFNFCDWSRQFLPVCMCGASPNKSLTTARALSERASTSFNSSWSENTCRSKTTSSSLPNNQKGKNFLKKVNRSPQTSLMMLMLAWSKGAGLPICLNRRLKAFSFSSHWAAALLWDLWISCRWFWWRNTLIF